MNNGIIGFMLGAGVASLITYVLMDRKIKALQNDNNETREYYRQRLKQYEGDQNETFEKGADGNKRHFRKVGPLSDQNHLKDMILKEHYNYSGVSKSSSERVEAPEEAKKLQIYEISDNEFNEDTEHDKITITWYLSQHILADDDEHRMSPEYVGGVENLKDFGNDDVKYIRNNNNKIDYEVILDDVNDWMDPEAE